MYVTYQRGCFRHLILHPVKDLVHVRYAERPVLLAIASDSHLRRRAIALFVIHIVGEFVGGYLMLFTRMLLQKVLLVIGNVDFLSVKSSRD